MKNNMLVPVEKDVPPVRCGLFRMTIKTMLEDPRASLFVEAIPLCIQLNLTVLMRLFFIHKVYTCQWPFPSCSSRQTMAILLFWGA